MLLNRLSVATLLATTALVIGCEAPRVGDADAGAQPQSGAAPDVIVDGATWDGNEAPPERARPTDTDGAEAQGFTLGVNVTGKNTPAFFEVLPEGGDLVVELGAQGLWMVVLAFKTHGYFDGRVLIRAWIDVNGERQGELALAKQKLLPGGDGWDYYYNFFLVVPDPALAGHEAVVTMQVEDDLTQELVIERQLNVSLIGGEL